MMKLSSIHFLMTFFLWNNYFLKVKNGITSSEFVFQTKVRKFRSER